MIEITPSLVLRSADAIREHGPALTGTSPPDDPGNPGFRTSTALRTWRTRMQHEAAALANETTALGDKLEASAQDLKRAEEQNVEAADAVRRAVAA